MRGEGNPLACACGMRGPLLYGNSPVGAVCNRAAGGCGQADVPTHVFGCLKQDFQDEQDFQDAGLLSSETSFPVDALSRARCLSNFSSFGLLGLISLSALVFHAAAPVAWQANLIAGAVEFPTACVTVRHQQPTPYRDVETLHGRLLSASAANPQLTRFPLP